MAKTEPMVYLVGEANLIVISSGVDGQPHVKLYPAGVGHSMNTGVEVPEDFAICSLTELTQALRSIRDA